MKIHVLDNKTPCLLLYNTQHCSHYIVVFNFMHETYDPFMMLVHKTVFENRLMESDHVINDVEYINILKYAMNNFLPHHETTMINFVKTIATQIMEDMCEREASSRGYNKATRKIQAHWLECMYNPSYALCRKRLMREFEELSSKNVHTM